jgi:hypothetical protein
MTTPAASGLAPTFPARRNLHADSDPEARRRRGPIAARRSSRLIRSVTRARSRKLCRFRGKRLGSRSNARKRLRQHRRHGRQLRRGRVPAGRGATRANCPLRSALTPDPAATSKTTIGARTGAVSLRCRRLDRLAGVARTGSARVQSAAIRAGTPGHRERRGRCCLAAEAGATRAPIAVRGTPATGAPQPRTDVLAWNSAAVRMIGEPQTAGYGLRFPGRGSAP